jgi:ribonuclease P protein component
MLPKTRKLTRRELQLVLRSGVQNKTSHFLVKSSPNQVPFSRFAVVISTKVYPHAHDRNHLKRGIFSNLPLSSAANLDVIISVFPSVVNLKDEVLYSEINQVLSKIFLKP